MSGPEEPLAETPWARGIALLDAGKTLEEVREVLSRQGLSEEELRIVLSALAANRLPARREPESLAPRDDLWLDPARAEVEATAPPSGTIKVDFDTPLESLFTGMLGLGWAGVLVLAWFGLVGNARHPPSPALLGYLLPTALFAVASSVLRWGTDNHYLIDTESRVISYHFEVPLFRSVRTFLTPDMIHAIGVTSRSRWSRREGTYHEYWVVLVDRQARLHVFSDRAKGDPQALNVRAEHLARVLKCQVIKGKPEHRLVASMTRGDVSARLVS